MGKFAQAMQVKVGDIVIISSGVFRVTRIKVDAMITMEIRPLGVKDPDNIPTSYSAHPWQFIETKQE